MEEAGVPGENYPFVVYKAGANPRRIGITSGAGTTSAPEHLDLPRFLVRFVLLNFKLSV
jgi:hypothetical protein